MNFTQDRHAILFNNFDESYTMMNSLMCKLIHEVVLRKFHEKKIKRKVQEVTQSQIAANRCYQNEAVRDTKHYAQNKQTQKSTQTSSIFPKRDDRNAKRTEKYKAMPRCIYGTESNREHSLILSLS